MQKAGMKDHLGYEKHVKDGENDGNSCIGGYP